MSTTTAYSGAGCDQCVVFLEQKFAFCAICGHELSKIIGSEQEAKSVNELMMLTHGLNVSGICASSARDTLHISRKSFTVGGKWLLYKPLFDMIFDRINVALDKDCGSLTINTEHDLKLWLTEHSNVDEVNSSILNIRKSLSRITSKLLIIPVMCSTNYTSERFLLTLTEKEIEDAIEPLQGKNWLLPEMKIDLTLQYNYKEEAKWHTKEETISAYSFAKFFVFYEQMIKEWYRKKLMEANGF